MIRYCTDRLDTVCMRVCWGYLFLQSVLVVTVIVVRVLVYCNVKLCLYYDWYVVVSVMPLLYDCLPCFLKALRALYVCNVRRIRNVHYYYYYYTAELFCLYCTPELVCLYCTPELVCLCSTHELFYLYCTPELVHLYWVFLFCFLIDCFKSS